MTENDVDVPVDVGHPYCVGPKGIEISSIKIVDELTEKRIDNTDILKLPTPQPHFICIDILYFERGKKEPFFLALYIPIVLVFLLFNEILIYKKKKSPKSLPALNP